RPNSDPIKIGSDPSLAPGRGVPRILPAFPRPLRALARHVPRPNHPEVTLRLRVQRRTAAIPQHSQPRDPPVQAYETLKKLIAEIEEDVRKAEGGNKAAGTRVRAAMQEIKDAAQEVRKAVLEMRNKPDDAATAGGGA